MNQPQLASHLDRRGDEVCLALAGELDLAVAGQLEAALTEAATPPPPTLIIDLGAVGFIDSHSIGILVLAYNAAQADGRTVILANPRGLVLHVLQVMGLQNLLTEAPDNATG